MSSIVNLKFFEKVMVEKRQNSVCASTAQWNTTFPSFFCGVCVSFCWIFVVFDFGRRIFRTFVVFCG